MNIFNKIKYNQMKEQKFLIVDSAKEVNDYLEKGWEVVTVTPQNVSVAITGSSWHEKELKGKFAVVIQKIKLVG
jgi:hypothetical protein